MKLAAIERIALHILSKDAEINAWEIERLGGHLGESYARELRRLRQMGLVDYEPTHIKGKYRLKMNGKREELRVWLQERMKKRYGAGAEMVKLKHLLSWGNYLAST